MPEINKYFTFKEDIHEKPTMAMVGEYSQCRLIDLIMKFQGSKKGVAILSTVMENNLIMKTVILIVGYHNPFFYYSILVNVKYLVYKFFYLI